MEQSEHLSLNSDTANTLMFSGLIAGNSASVVDEVVIEMDRLSVGETRDLLISTLFVLKHLDSRKTFCRGIFHGTTMQLKVLKSKVTILRNKNKPIL